MAMVQERTDYVIRTTPRAHVTWQHGHSIFFAIPNPPEMGRSLLVLGKGAPIARLQGDSTNVAAREGSSPCGGLQSRNTFRRDASLALGHSWPTEAGHGA